MAVATLHPSPMAVAKYPTKYLQALNRSFIRLCQGAVVHGASNLQPRPSAGVLRLNFNE